MHINIQTMNHIELGAYGEEQSRHYLINQGYYILGQNIRTPLGELDILAQKDSILVVVEVKTRRTRLYGLPCEAVSWHKQQHIKGDLQWHLQYESLNFTTIRFDVMEVYIQADKVRLRHLQGCFE